MKDLQYVILNKSSELGKLTIEQRNKIDPVIKKVSILSISFVDFSIQAQ